MSRKSEAASLVARVDTRATRVGQDRDAANVATVALLRVQVQQLQRLVLDLYRLQMLSMRDNPADLTDINV